MGVEFFNCKSSLQNFIWILSIISMFPNPHISQPYNNMGFTTFSQVGFLKKSSFKESSGILLVFSPTYLFTLFQGRWIQKSMLAIRKMSFNVTKWRTKWLPKKTTFENKPYSALFINGPYESYLFVYITWYYPLEGGGGGVRGKYLLYHQSVG